MSFDMNLSAGVQREIERYARAEHISTTEAATKLIEAGLKVKRRKAETATDTEVEAFYTAFPGFKALGDVTDEQWNGLLKTARRMSRQGLSPRG